MKTIKITEETHKMLTEIGKKGQSYNTIIFNLIKIGSKK